MIPVDSLAALGVGGAIQRNPGAAASSLHVMGGLRDCVISEEARRRRGSLKVVNPAVLGGEPPRRLTRNQASAQVRTFVAAPSNLRSEGRASRAYVLARLRPWARSIMRGRSSPTPLSRPAASHLGGWPDLPRQPVSCCLSTH